MFLPRTVILCLVLLIILDIHFLKEITCYEISTEDDSNISTIPTFDKSLLPNRTQCGQQSLLRIIGGETTELWEFPWLVLLQYKETNGDLSFECGGSILNNRYILTAAHCVTGQALRDNRTLENVRLGEWDTRTIQDCISTLGFEDCNDPHIDVGIEKSIPHPNFGGTKQHDIALIRMKQEVAYTDFIKPICLPLPFETPIPGQDSWVAGWGETRFDPRSPVKLKVRLPIAQQTDCYDTFIQLGVTIWDTQICAGGERRKDACKGDSGGPLMQMSNDDVASWIVQGIVSFGVRRCGTENYYGVYTRVIEYLDWIHNNIED